jgi:DNA-directed RNA polymerase subunit E'/Rpb7
MNTYLDFGSRVLCEQKIFLNPDELNSDMETTIEERVKEFEGSCNNQGYIVKNSVSIIDRKVGVIPNSELIGGKGKFHITLQAVILCPRPNHLIPFIVKEKNTIGILSHWGYDNTFPIVATCLKQNHTSPTLRFEDIDINDFIIVKVLSARCNLKDTKIVVSGEALQKIDEKTFQQHIQDFMERMLLSGRNTTTYRK